MGKGTTQAPLKLHMGCGAVTPSGWVNIDGSWNARVAKFSWLRRGLRWLHLVPQASLRIPCRILWIEEVERTPGICVEGVRP